MAGEPEPPRGLRPVLPDAEGVLDALRPLRRVPRRMRNPCPSRSQRAGGRASPHGPGRRVPARGRRPSRSAGRWPRAAPPRSAAGPAARRAVSSRRGCRRRIRRRCSRVYFAHAPAQQPSHGVASIFANSDPLPQPEQLNWIGDIHLAPVASRRPPTFSLDQRPDLKAGGAHRTRKDAPRPQAAGRRWPRSGSSAERTAGQPSAFLIIASVVAEPPSASEARRTASSASPDLVAEGHQRRHRVGVGRAAGGRGRPREADRERRVAGADPALQLDDQPLGGLLADPRALWRASRRRPSGSRPDEQRERQPAHDGERHLGADSRHVLDHEPEEVAVLRGRESVEGLRVLAVDDERVELDRRIPTGGSRSAVVTGTFTS